MVSTPEEVTDDIPNVPMTSILVKQQSASKPMCLFTNILNVKKKTLKRRVGAAKSNHRSMKVVNILWTNKTKRKEHSKINE